MVRSHADEATIVGWIEDAGLSLTEVCFIPKDDSGHTPVLPQKPGASADKPIPAVQ